LSLDACIVPDGNEGLRPLLHAPFARAIVELSLRGNELTADAVTLLVASPLFEGLGSLDLGPVEASNPIGDQGAEVIAGARASRSLRFLGLEDRAIGDRGAAALASSEHLVDLQRLSLRKNPVSARGAATLRDQYGDRVELDG
jgi:hypothetical protein